jgi:hypothetical protein
MLFTGQSMLAICRSNDQDLLVGSTSISTKHCRAGLRGRFEERGNNRKGRYEMRSRELLRCRRCVRIVRTEDRENRLCGGERLMNMNENGSIAGYLGNGLLIWFVEGEVSRKQLPQD